MIDYLNDVWIDWELKWFMEWLVHLLIFWLIFDYLQVADWFAIVVLNEETLPIQVFLKYMQVSIARRHSHMNRLKIKPKQKTYTLLK